MSNETHTLPPTRVWIVYKFYGISEVNFRGQWRVRTNGACIIYSETFELRSTNTQRGIEHRGVPQNDSNFIVGPGPGEVFEFRDRHTWKDPYPSESSSSGMVVPKTNVVNWILNRIPCGGMGRRGCRRTRTTEEDSGRSLYSVRRLARWKKGKESGLSHVSSLEFQVNSDVIYLLAEQSVVLFEFERGKRQLKQPSGGQKLRNEQNFRAERQWTEQWSH